MSPPEVPYQPYADDHRNIEGPGDARPTAVQVVKDCDAYGKLGNKTILITGCSSGLGVETAKALYETGAKLFLTARNISKLEEVINDIVTKSETKGYPRPEAIEIHLDDLASVRKGAESFKTKSGGKLNILIHNAGVMATPYGKTKDGLELQIGTNHFAHFLLFQLLKDTMLQSAKDSGTTSRVINLSSGGHHFSRVRLDDINWEKDYNKWQSYGSSKTANIYMANSITRHYGTQNLQGLSVHPGGILTDLSRHLTEEDYAFLGDLEQMKKTFKTPEQGAATTVWAAVSPHFEGKNGGHYLEDVGESRPHPGPESEGTGHAEWAYDEEAEEKLWKLSCEAVGVPIEN
ncbi:hypothetical protein LTR36_006203 [Oleoguttula mirabilis]|uniref:Short-chain dehydrogenase n=1 Tax=Oleoguttula mirabilis TaxID=1507867 RepID=A0AAV9JCF1_9PEZI|nr:hypothetical protein LTR36_006203 [Oleoguttula mirabilis]